MLDQFIAQTQGQRLSYDGIPDNAGQCVQTVEKWCQFKGLPVLWANAAAWWTAYGGEFAAHWEKIPNDKNNPNQLPSPGDIVVFSKTLPGSGGYGHLDIFVRSTGPNSWIGYDSNWPVGSGAHEQSHTWSYVLGWFTPKAVPTAPSSASPTTSLPYDIQGITQKQVLVKGGSREWNLNYTTFKEINDNPIGVMSTDTAITVNALLKHQDGYSYYLPNINTPHGYNVLDCSDYTPTAPPVNPAPPSGAAPIPTPVEQYAVVVELNGYATSNQAANHLSPTTVVHAGTYSVFNKKVVDGKTLAVNVTTQPGKAGNWINPDDNHEPIPEPEPTPEPKDNGWTGPREASEQPEQPPLQPVVRESQIPRKPSEVPIGTQADNTWKSSYKVLNPQNHSEEYELVQPWTMKEYGGKKNPVPLADGTKLNITGTFTKNGVKFYRTRSARDEYFSWWYAIPAVDDNSRAVIVKLPPEKPQPTETETLTLQDLRAYWKNDISRLKIWDVIRKKVK